MNTKRIKEQFKNIVLQYKNILYFLILFLLADFIWKIFIHFGPNDNENIMLLLGHDITHYFDSSCYFLAKCFYFILHTLLGYHNFHVSQSIVYFDNSIPIDIIWSCLGLKQYFMFVFVMIFYYGPKSKKIYYILLGLAVLFVFNILRLLFILLIIKNPFPEWFIVYNEWKHGITWVNGYECYYKFYQDWYQLFHKEIFTWLYYDGVLFVLWLIWEEKFNKPSVNIEGTQKSDK